MLRVRFLPPTNLFACTALTPTHMAPLVERMWARHPDAGRGRPWRLGFADRVLLVALAYRTNLTERQLAVLFGVAPSVAHRVIADLAPALAALLGPPPADRRHLWVVDGTLIPVHDQSRTAKSRNYRRSVNVEVVVRRRDWRVVAVGHAWPGNRNDVAVWKGCGVAAAVTGHGRLIGDGGYRGAPDITSPKRGPGGRIVRDDAHRRFGKRRATADTSSPRSRTGRFCASAADAKTASTTP